MTTAEPARVSKSPRPEYQLARRRFIVLGLLWFIEFVFWAAWFIQSPLLVSYWGARQHVSFGSAEWLMSGVDVAAIFTAFISGYIYDRVGPKYGVALILGVVTIGFGLRPLAVHSFSWMLALSIIAGAGLPIQAAPPAVVSRWFGHHRIAFPLGVVVSAFAVGQTVGLLVGPAMVTDLGAGWAFTVFSVALVAALAAWLSIVPKGPRTPAGPEAKPLPALFPALRGLIRSKGSMLLFSIGAIYAGIAVFGTSFLPGVMGASFRLDPSSAGSSVAAFPGLEIPGMLVIGYAASRSAKLRMHGFWTAGVQLLLWGVFAATWWLKAQPLGLALLLIGALGFFYLPCFAFGLTAAERLGSTDSGRAGAAAGFYFTGVSIGGYVFPTLIAGVVNTVGDSGGFVSLLVLAALGVIVWGWLLRSMTTSEAPGLLH